MIKTRKVNRISEKSDDEGPPLCLPHLSHPSSSFVSDDVANLPIPLHNVIQRKAKNSKPEKTYLLHIPRYPDLCKFLRDKARSSFDQRPTEDQVRPLIAKHMSEQLALDKKIRQRVRDELREIHRSYMRTFMIDPHGTHKAGPKSQLLAAKQSPT